MESPNHRAAVRLNWDGQAKKWLLTAYQKEDGSATDTTTDITSLDGKDDTARLPDASDAILKRIAASRSGSCST